MNCRQTRVRPLQLTGTLVRGASACHRGRLLVAGAKHQRVETGAGGDLHTVGCAKSRTQPSRPASPVSCWPTTWRCLRGRRCSDSQGRGQAWVSEWFVSEGRYTDTLSSGDLVSLLRKALRQNFDNVATARSTQGIVALRRPAACEVMTLIQGGALVVTRLSAAIGPAPPHSSSGDGGIW